MPKNDNAMSMRLYESMKSNVSEDAANEMVESFPLSKSADFVKKFQWAKDVCAYLEENYDEAKVRQIRMDCACTPPAKVASDLRSLYLKCGDAESFAKAYQSKSDGAFTITYEDGAFYLTYPCCYCSCVKRVSETISKSWCYCTLGYTKRMFDTILDSDTSVELMESVKTGGSRCVMKITV